jgi:hypothetical protein
VFFQQSKKPVLCRLPAFDPFDKSDLIPVNLPGIICVFDGQFYTEHEDLHFIGTWQNNFDPAIDGFSHGTHVAGTIGASFNNRKGITCRAERQFVRSVA